MTATVSVFNDDKHVVVLIPKKDAAHLGIIIDACLDTVGNIEGRDVDLTTRQITKAEDNMIALANKLQETAIK